MKWIRKVKSFLRATLFVAVALVVVYVVIALKINSSLARRWLVPLNTGARSEWSSLQIPEESDKFLATRAAYRHLPKHIHTGVDLNNPKGGPGEPVYSVAKGKVIDVRNQGTGTRITIEHLLPNGGLVYTSYIHISGIKVRKGKWVSEKDVIARTFNEEELKKYGRIYDHLHFQVHKGSFVPSYTVNSFTEKQALDRFYDPEKIFKYHYQDVRENWLKWLAEKKISWWEFIKLLF